MADLHLRQPFVMIGVAVMKGADVCEVDRTSVAKVLSLLHKRPGTGITTIEKILGLPMPELRACLGFMMGNDVVRYRTTSWSNGVYWFAKKDSELTLNEMWGKGKLNHPELWPEAKRRTGDSSHLVAKAVEQGKKTRSHLILALQELDGPQTAWDLATHVQVPLRTVQRNLTTLQEEGLVDVARDNHPDHRGRPAHLWSLGKGIDRLRSSQEVVDETEDDSSSVVDFGEDLDLPIIEDF